MGFSAIISILTIITVIIVLVEIGIIAYYIIVSKSKEKDYDSIDSIKESKTSSQAKQGTVLGGKFHGVLNMQSIYDFMEFDDIKDGMILRGNGDEYVMVLECNGVNFDLMSENEKLIVEEGFQQFLNAIKYPVQLYVQTRGLNFDTLLASYEASVERLSGEIEESNKIIEAARKEGDESKLKEEIANKERKLNILDYAQDSIRNTKILSNNKNVLHQKTYVVVSYHVAELGMKVTNYSKDELIDIAFDELLVRCNNLSRALVSSGVSSKVLNSEELIELLFNSYNRDATEYMSIENYIESDYDALYSTAKDVLDKRKEKIEEEISLEAIDLATRSMITATRKKKEELKKMQERKPREVKKMAKEYIKEYKDVIDDGIYEGTIKEIDEAEE